MSGSGMDGVRDGLARGLARFVAPARLPDGYAPAFARTPEGAVFDLAANAAAAEVLAHPMLGGGDGAVALLLALAGGDGPAPRALGPARLAVADDNPRAFRITTPHHLFTGDLFRGEIRQHLHGVDGPPAAIHGGNLVEFAFRRRWHCLDVEDAIVAAGIEDAEGGVRLFHDSVLSGRGGRFSPGGPREVARLRYAYELRADTPVVALTITLTPLAGVTLLRPRITTACDAMSPGDGVDYSTLMLGDAMRDSPAGQNVTVQDGPVATFGARQRRSASRALSLHVTPRGPATLLNVKASGPAAGRLHWLLARYAADRITDGAPLIQREERLLLRGTRAAIDAPRGADAASAAPRQQIAAALATQALLGDPRKAAPLWAAAERTFAALSAEEAAPAELAHALMIAGMLVRAGRDGGDRAALAARLLATQAPDGVFRDAQDATMADHATALLALARHVAAGDAEPAGAALRRGITVLALTTLAGPVDTITIPAAPAAAGIEDLALLLRALRAAQAARAAGALVMPDAEAGRLAFLADLALRLMQARIRPEGDALVVEGSVSAQVAALAALVPPEGAMR